MLQGMAGDFEVGSRAAVLPHKKEACVASKACKGSMATWLTRTQLPSKTACAACRQIVSDLDSLLFREKAKIPSKKRLGTIIETLCSDLGLRHDDVAFLEQHCDELIDGLQGDAMREEDSVLVGNIKLRKRLESAGMKMSNTLADKVCQELQGYCEASDEAGEQAGEQAGDAGEAVEAAARPAKRSPRSSSPSSDKKTEL